jgi:hypothetical protein
MPNIPTLNPENENDIREALAREHLRPEMTFQGKPLWPYTAGTRLLLMQVRGDDTGYFLAWTFVFIHLKRTEATCKADLAKHLLKQAWDDLPAFRSEVLEFAAWASERDPDAQDEALRIMQACFEAEQKSAVAVASDPASGQKKTQTEQPIQMISLGSATPSHPQPELI